MRKLVCSATSSGVTMYRKNGNIFYPKQVTCKQPPKKSTYDEIFLDRCLRGTKNIPTFVLENMDLAEVEKIKILHRRSMALIINLKKEIAERWTTSFLKPIHRHPIVQELEIHDIPRDLYLEIEIPRPLLLHHLTQIQKDVYQDQD